MFVDVCVYIIVIKHPTRLGTQKPMHGYLKPSCWFSGIHWLYFFLYLTDARQGLSTDNKYYP